MRYVLLALLVLAPHAGAADSAPTLIDERSLATATQLRERALKNNEAWIMLESLTTEVGHRMGGSPADARAVAWAVERFRLLGYDRVYTEPVTFPVWRRGTESVEIVRPFPHELRASALGSTVGTGRRAIEGEVVEFSTLAALEAANPDQVRGRIVFIGNRMQRMKDGSGYSPAVKARSDGPFVAAQKGARALLIRSIGTDDSRVAHTGSAVSRRERLRDAELVERSPRTRSGIPVIATPIPAAALSNPDADLLSRVLERGRPVTVRVQLDVGFEGEHTSANVIGEITGRGRPDEVVLIGGHLDSWDQGTGAVDDGAGIAITMAAGFLIGKLDEPPRRTIRVVAFANEENGLFGANAYRDAHAADVAQHVLAAESDFGADRIWRLDTAVKPGALGAIDQIMQVLAPLGIERGLATTTGGADVGPMHEAGMAVATLLQDGTRYFDLHHTENDTLDKVDPEALRQNVAAYAVFAYLAAQAQGDFGSAPATPAPQAGTVESR